MTSNDQYKSGVGSEAIVARKLAAEAYKSRCWAEEHTHPGWPITFISASRVERARDAALDQCAITTWAIECAHMYKSDTSISALEQAAKKAFEETIAFVELLRQARANHELDVMDD